MSASDGFSRTVHLTEHDRVILKGLLPVRFVVEFEDPNSLFPDITAEALKEAALGTLRAYQVPIDSSAKDDYFPVLQMRIVAGLSKGQIIWQGWTGLYEQLALVRDPGVILNLLLWTKENRSGAIEGGLPRFAMILAHGFAEQYAEANRAVAEGS